MIELIENDTDEADNLMSIYQSLVEFTIQYLFFLDYEHENCNSSNSISVENVDGECNFIEIVTQLPIH